MSDVMTSDVIINDLADLPHANGQTVLHAEREDFRVEIRREAGTSYYYSAESVLVQSAESGRLGASRRTGP